MLDTRPLLTPTDFPPIVRDSVETLQVNLGYLCNLSCTHCHVNAGPKRTELMTLPTIKKIEKILEVGNIKCLDVTGGSPEMNPHFKRLVRSAREMGVDVIDRCNLTIMEEPGYEDIAEFLAEHSVCIVASLPCYSEENVRQQRGNGVFESSIRVLQQLNQLGYGIDDNLELHLMYNPNGAFLPPSQQSLELDYKRILKEHFNIVFDQLFTLTNMPIQRFGGVLLSKGIYHDYMDLLKTNFNQKNLDQVMCKTTLSIDWQGFVYDCDFNQMLDIPTNHDNGHDHDNNQNQTQTQIGATNIATDKKLHIDDFINNDCSMLSHRPIVIGEHCYGCTAGQGSSCGGAL